MEDRERRNFERMRMQDEKISMMDSKITDQNNIITSIIMQKILKNQGFFFT